MNGETAVFHNPIFKRALLIVLPTIVGGVAFYWLIEVYLGPLSDKAQSRVTDIIFLVQYLIAVTAWIHALYENKRLRAEIKALKSQSHQA